MTARGPDFAKGKRLDTQLNNVDIYPLLCGLLRIECKRNNGTIEPFLSVLEPSARHYAQTKLTFT